MSQHSEKFVYDRTLRELFQDVPRALIQLLVGKEIKEVLETSFPKSEESICSQDWKMIRSFIWRSNPSTIL